MNNVSAVNRSQLCNQITGTPSEPEGVDLRTNMRADLLSGDRWVCGVLVFTLTDKLLCLYVTECLEHVASQICHMSELTIYTITHQRNSSL